MTDWVRLWHDMPTDPKWRVVARKSGQPLPCVIAVFNLIMVNASANAAERGTLCGWSNEDAGAALDMEESDVAAIYAAMQGKVLDGDRLSGWERRQPKREDDSKERVRKHREDKKRDVTQGNAPETETEEDTDKKDPPKPPFGLNEAMELWNDMAAKAGVPKVRGLNEQRKTWFKERLDEHGEDGIREAIAAVGRSKFCCGDNDRKWRADFGFMIQAKSFLKLIEGSFDPAGEGPGANPPMSLQEQIARVERSAALMDSLNREDDAAVFRKQAAQLRAGVGSGPPRSIGQLAQNIAKQVTAA